MSQHVLILLGWLACSFGAAAFGALASSDAGPFYQQLQRPSWAPPSWVFGPVWTLLYFLMGISAWLVWREGGGRKATTPLLIFLLQLVANALWSWLFFAWRLGALAFGEILLLWVLVFLALISFWRVRPIAGLLLVPYLTWLTFASALTYTIWKRNLDLLG
ncbi:MAG: TspO/MBR family protein [Thermodesulfobacteriota bacterium]